MPFFRRLSHRHFFVFYAVLGLGLGGYWWSLRRDQEMERLRFHLQQTMIQSGLELGKWNEGIRNQVFKASDIAPTPERQDYALRADHILLVGSRMENLILRLIDLPVCPSFSWHLQQIEERMSNVRDTLCWLTLQDSASAAIITPLLETTSLLASFKKLSQEDSLQFLLLRDNLLWKTQLAQYYALTFLEERAGPRDYDIYFDSYTPLLSVNGESPITGMPFKAELHLLGYSNDDQIPFLLNGQSMENRKGISYWSGQFNSRGGHNLKLTIGHQKERNNLVKTDFAEFKIPVFKP